MANVPRFHLCFWILLFRDYQHTENGKYGIHELQGTGSVMTRTEKGGKSCSMSLGTSTYTTKPIFETQGCNLYRIDLILPQQIKQRKRSITIMSLAQDHMFINKLFPPENLPFFLTSQNLIDHLVFLPYPYWLLTSQRYHCQMDGHWAEGVVSLTSSSFPSPHMEALVSPHE